MKLIDADKQIEWIKQELDKTPKEWPTSFECGRAAALKEVMKLLEGDRFDPTPPVQPAIKCQDKVRYTGDIHRLTRGTVRCVFHDDFGHWADVYDRIGGAVHTVRLDKLEVITDDPST